MTTSTQAPVRFDRQADREAFPRRSHMIGFATAAAGIAVMSVMVASSYLAAHAPRTLVRVRSR
ncbi:hypothetical protein DMB37_22080 [Nocardia sp. CS682]|nr:hypothetical protein DMB37_22080 [Nocardia sp. CS682]